MSGESSRNGCFRGVILGFVISAIMAVCMYSQASSPQSVPLVINKYLHNQARPPAVIQRKNNIYYNTNSSRKDNIHSNRNASSANWYYSPWEIHRQSKYNYNCSAIYHGDLEYTKSLAKALQDHPYTMTTSDEVRNWAADCKAYRPYFHFRDKHITEEERLFPIAFSIRMHHAVEQAEQLLRRIYAPQNLYCIYIDKKSPEDVHKAMEQIASCFDNVFIASKLKNFYYASSSHVEADKQCMKDALQKGSSWKYFVNLVGEDFPTKTNLELVKILRMLNGSNGIDSGPVNPGQLRDRTRFVYKIIGGENVKTSEARPPFDSTTKFYKGAEYGLFSREFVKWSLHADYPRKLFEYFAQGTYASDEIYWATINRHVDAPGGYRYDTPRYSKARIWVYGHGGRRDDFPCRGPVVRAICIFTIKELLWLARQPEPFANKFKMEMDAIALDCLGERLALKQVYGVTEDLSYIMYNPVIYDKVFHPEDYRKQN